MLRRQDNNSKQEFEDVAAVTESKLIPVGEGKTIWKLNQWNDPNHSKYLAMHANCVVTLDENLPSFCFFLKEARQREDPYTAGRQTTYSVENECLPLNVAWVSSANLKLNGPFPLKAYENIGFGFTIRVTVGRLDEERVTINRIVPGTYHVFQDTLNGSYDHYGSPTQLTIMEKFILLSTTTTASNQNGQQPPQVENYPQPETLSFGIKVELFKCTDGPCLPTFKMNGKSAEESAEVSSIYNDFHWMYEQADNYSDLKLESMDGMIINTHKFVLAARNPKLRALVQMETKRNDFSETIKIQDVSAKSLIVILQWVYTGKLDDKGISENIIEEVIVAAAKYELNELLKLTEKELIKVCNSANILDIFKLSKKYGMESATKYISAFIKENIGC